MSRRRRFLLIALPVALVLLGVSAWVLWPRHPQATAITLENAKRIRPGMRLAEVSAILGGPPRHEITGMVNYCLDDIEGVDRNDPRQVEWLSDEALVLIFLDEQYRVQRCEPVAVEYEGNGIRALVRRWLRL
jgi:hypothetical protein